MSTFRLERPSRIAQISSSMGLPSADVDFVTSGAPVNGLRFPSNGESGTDDTGNPYTGDIFTPSNYIAFTLSGANLPPSPWPMTYVWQIKPRAHIGYHTTFFWGNIANAPWFAAGFYGFHPYPPNGSSPHFWEVSTNGTDIVAGVGGVSTALQYDRWFTQAARVTNPSSTNLRCEFWFDLGIDIARKIDYTATGFTTTFPEGTPGIVFGDAPWSRVQERMSGTLGPVKILTTALSDSDIVQEAADMTQLVTTAAQSARWWFKPTFASATDLTDSVTGRSGVWATVTKARLEVIS